MWTRNETVLVAMVTVDRNVGIVFVIKRPVNYSNKYFIIGCGPKCSYSVKVDMR